MQKMHSQNGKQREATFGTKLATIEYAAATQGPLRRNAWIP